MKSFVLSYNRMSDNIIVYPSEQSAIQQGIVNYRIVEAEDLKEAKTIYQDIINEMMEQTEEE